MKWAEWRVRKKFDADSELETEVGNFEGSHAKTDDRNGEQSATGESK
jgi:hypothetical protein